MGQSTDGQNPTDAQLVHARSTYESLSRRVVEQDQRVARLLTAIAFFIGAAIAAVGQEPVRQTRFIFANHASAKLAVLALGWFILGGVLSTVYLVLSLGPNENYWDAPYKEHPQFLSFMEVAEGASRFRDYELHTRGPGLARDEWTTLIEGSIEEAMRARFKFGYIAEARAALFLSLPGLAVATVALVAAASADQPTAHWDGRMASVCAFAFFVLTFLAGDDRAQSERSSTAPASGVFRSLALWLGLHAGLVVLSTLGGTRQWSPWIATNLGASSAVLLAARAIAQWRRARREITGTSHEFRVLDSLGSPLVVAISLPQLVVAFFPAQRAYELVLALIPLAILEGVRFFDRVNWTRRTLGPGGKQGKSHLEAST